jgi:hypothetical protein
MSAGRLLLLGLLAGFAVLFARELPGMKRYLKIDRM